MSLSRPRHASVSSSSVCNSGDGNGGEGLLCVICNKLTRASHEEDIISDPSEVPNDTCFGTEDEASERIQLRTLFLLKQIVRYPLLKIEEAFHTFGNPTEWFRMCKNCSRSIDEAMAIRRNIKEMTAKLQRITDSILQEVSLSAPKTVNLPFGDSGDVAGQNKVFRLNVRAYAVQQFSATESLIGASSTLEQDVNLTFKEEQLSPLSVDQDDSYDVPASPVFKPNEIDVRLYVGEDANDQEDLLEKSLEPCQETIPKIKRKVRSGNPHKLVKRLRYETPSSDPGEPDSGSDWEPERPIKKIKTKQGDVRLAETENEPGDDGDGNTSAGGRQHVRVGGRLQKLDLHHGVDTGVPPTKPQNRIINLMGDSRVFVDMAILPYPFSAEDIAKLPRKPRSKKKKIMEYGTTRTKTEYMCPACGDPTYFKSKSLLIAHVHKVHLGIENPWKCDICPKTTSNPRCFLRHLEIHDAGRIPGKHCQHCNFKSRSESMVRTHTIKKHKKSQNNPQCDVCNLTCTNFQKFITHMINEHNWKLPQWEKNEHCNLCNKNFNKEIALKFHHVMNHGAVDVEGIFPRCDQCAQPYMNISELNFHIARTHDKSETFFCEQCGSVFYVKRDLNRHLARKHHVEFRK